jgi:hypothetical protein
MIMSRCRNLIYLGIILNCTLATASRNQLELQEVGYIGGNGAGVLQPIDEQRIRDVSAGERPSSMEYTLMSGI